MSSYEVGGADVGAMLIGAPVAIGAALAVLTPIAGGYALYSIGKGVHDELVREHQEALEHQIQEAAKLRKRFENAKEIRKKIIEECTNRINELKTRNVWNDESLSALVQSTLLELNDIVEETEQNDVNNLELQNERAVYRIKILADRLETESRLIKENSVENAEMASFVEAIQIMFRGLSANDYRYIHNIEIEEEMYVELRKLYERLAELTEQFYLIVEREVIRFGNYPIKSISVDRISQLFETISSEIKSIEKMNADVWILEGKISSIEKGIDAYYTFKAGLDKEQEKFLTMYLLYKESCEKIGEECKEAVEFDSIEELEYEIKTRINMLELSQRRRKLYDKLGKEAYICMAFETELNKLNYFTVNKQEAEVISSEQLRNYKLGDQWIPCYEYGDDSMMQIFRINDEVGMQLIIHRDGSSTMETISLVNDVDTVISTQKKHCEMTEKLKSALAENWFVLADFEEERSANVVSMQFEQTLEEDVQRDVEVRIGDRVRRERERRRRRNSQKVKERSMSLRY